MNKQTLAVVAALLLIFLGATLAIFLARGYRLDISRRSVSPTGILVATSDPDGAEVIIDGKLKTATNNTINLDPGSYEVKIQKEGFTPWQKKITIRQEEVFKTNVFLFPQLPDLRPLTFTGALSPTVSPDSARVVYGVASSSARLNGNGVWVMDMGRSFLPTTILSSPDLRQISYQNFDHFFWSPDGKQILADSYLLDTDKINNSPLFIASPGALLIEWKTQLDERERIELTKLSPGLKNTLATSAGKLTFSPDGAKILYLATASATLPPGTLSLPGSNPTLQTRQIEPNKTYVYDLKEDKNYKIGEPVSWFPSSRHLLSVANNQIAIMEYDGTNKVTIFNGQFSPQSVFAWPNWSKIIILTSLGNPGGQENLYTINLR